MTTFMLLIRGLARATACLVLGVLVSATAGAQPPADQSSKQYAFGLYTLNVGATVRRGQVKFDLDDAMTEDDLESVKHVLDPLGASPVDNEGYRHFSMPNGTRVRIGGFLVEGFPEDSVESVRGLAVEFSVKDEFSTSEAALVLRIAAAGNLFIASSADADRVATPARIDDRRFYKRHKEASTTPDEKALAEWVRQNISPRDGPAEAGRPP